MPAKPWEELRDRFLAYAQAARAPPGADWREGWQLVVGNPWFQEQLARYAQKLAGRRCPRDWLEELKQEAMAVLARQFESTIDLRVDLKRAQLFFAPWMRRIIYRTCQEALRRLQRLYGRSGTFPTGELVDTRKPLLEARLELSLAIDRLVEPQRSVLTLYSKGFNLRQIAVRLDMSYRTTRRVWHVALGILESLLGGTESP